MVVTLIFFSMVRPLQSRLFIKMDTNAITPETLSRSVIAVPP